MSTPFAQGGAAASPNALPSGANPANSSPLEEERRRFVPAVPHVLLSGEFEVVKGEKTTALGQAEAIAERFPQIYGQPFVDLVPANAMSGAPAAAPAAPASIVPQPSTSTISTSAQSSKNSSAARRPCTGRAPAAPRTAATSCRSHP